MQRESAVRLSLNAETSTEMLEFVLDAMKGIISLMENVLSETLKILKLLAAKAGKMEYVYNAL